MALFTHKGEELDILLQTAPIDPRQVLHDAPMSFAQCIGVFLMLVLFALNGFDTLSASFAAPGIKVAWHVTHATLGLIIAMNLIGMTAGSIFLAPMGDRIGRRNTILISLAAASLSMFLSAAANAPIMLATLRLITGLAIGATLGSATALAAEYANTRNRSLAVVCMGVGFPIGGAVGGIIVSMLLTHYSWRSIFLLGGEASLIVLCLMFFMIRESIDFLMSQQKPNALHKVNKILVLYGHTPLSTLPLMDKNKKNHVSIGEIFSSEFRGITISMLLLQTGQITTVYYFLNWLPQMVADMGFHGAIAAKVAAWMNIGGIVGALVIGLGARRINIRLLVGLTMAGSAVAVVLFSRTPADVNILKLVATLAGFMLLGCTIGLTALMAQVFPSKVRATGVGVAYGFGHFGSIVASIVPGYFFTLGLRQPSVSLIMACGSLFAIVVLWRFTLMKFALNPV
jgi:benzoate transport